MEATASSSTPTSGMWAPYEPPEIGEPLDTLNDVPAFVLVDVHVREGVSTQYGPRDAVDMTVATATEGVTRLFSGFAAGIVGQAKRLESGDLPALVRIVETTAGRGKTRGLALVEKLAPGADVAAIARAQSTPIMPTQGHNPHDDIPY